MSLRFLSAALALGLGLSGATVGVSPAVAAVDPGTVSVAIAVPITVPGGTDALLGADELLNLMRPSGSLARQLDAVINRPVTIAIDPRIIVSVRALGTSAPPTALGWLARLESATNPVFPLAYADADLTLTTQAGAATVPQVESLDFAIDAELFAAEASDGPTPAPPTADATVPSTADLLAWPYESTHIAWPLENTVVSTDLPVLAASGYTTTILSSTNVETPAGGGAAATVAGQGVVVSDSTASEHLRVASSAATEEVWDAAMAALESQLVSSSSTQPDGASVLITLDRGPLGFANRLSDTLARLQSLAGISLVSALSLAERTSVEATIIDMPQGQERVDRVARALQAEAAERSFATVADDPGRITAARRAELMALLASDWRSSSRGWIEAVDQFIVDSEELRSSVQLVQGDDATLWADNGQFLPITIRNDLSQPVTVVVTVKPNRALLSVDEGPVQVVVDAGVRSTTNVPVQSLANGIVTVQVSLSTTDGVPLGSPIRTEVNVQAGWETPIVVILAALVVVILILGIVRTVIRGRRARND
jgi:hypothetical protein